MRLFVCLIYFFIVGCFHEDGGEWSLAKNEKGIAIFSRKIASTEFRELKAIVTVKASLNSIVNLLYDWDSYPKWVYKCGRSYTLKEISPTEEIHYETIQIPWPYESQDLVINIKFVQDEKTKTVTITSTCNSNYIPPVASHIRITEYYAVWTLVPLKNGTVQVTHQLAVNSTGLIAWAVNMVAIDGTYETMSNFKEWAIKEKYQKVKNPLVKEFN
jgi:hypothetical protein